MSAVFPIRFHRSQVDYRLCCRRCNCPVWWRPDRDYIDDEGTYEAGVVEHSHTALDLVLVLELVRRN